MNGDERGHVVLTRDEVSDLIRRYADTFDDDVLAAKALGISVATLSIALNSRAKIGPVLLEFLGLERIDRYRVNRLSCRFEDAIRDNLIPRSREYDDARRSSEASAADGSGGWLAKGVRPVEGDVGAELEPEHPRAAAFAGRVSTRHRVRARRELPQEGPRSAARDLGRRRRLSLAQVRELVDAGHEFTTIQRRAAMQTVRILSHPNCRASQETRVEAIRLHEILAGKRPPDRPKRAGTAPRDLTGPAIRRAKNKLSKEIEEYGLVVITADTPALMAAADELVLDGFAQAVSDRIERVRGGPTAAGSATRRERRVLKITGDQRI